MAVFLRAGRVDGLGKGGEPSEDDETRNGEVPPHGKGKIRRSVWGVNGAGQRFLGWGARGRI